VAVVPYIQFCLAMWFMHNMILLYTHAGYVVPSVFVAATERWSSLISQQFFSLSRICITRDFESESGLWNCEAWLFYTDSFDFCIQIPFRLLHPLPSRYSRTHLKIINIHIWKKKLASVVGMSWYVMWEEYILQRRKFIWFCNSLYPCKPRFRSLKGN
jgi:hypothetical protein